MSPAAGAAAGGGAAAAMARMMAEEEEVMTPYQPGEVAEYEFKILRSLTGAFKKPENLRAALEEEARAGWELVEKFDNGRLRLKRRIEWRQKDADLEHDPYRTNYGMSEGQLVAYILIAVFGGIGLLGAIAVTIVFALK